MKKKIFYLAAISALSILLLSFLYFNADIPNKYPNGFRRQFSKVQIIKQHILDNLTGSYYYSGRSGREVVIGDFKNARIVAWDPENGKSRMIHSNMLRDTVFRRSIPRVTVDSPFVFFSSETAEVIVQINLQMDTVCHISRPGSFSGFVPLNDRSFIIRAYDTVNKQNDIHYISQDTVLHKKPPLLQKQYDGFFCTDGMLRPAGQIYPGAVYIYYYRNQMISIDNSFHLLHRARTIDTVSTAKIKMTENKNWQSLASPPWIVNKDAFVHGKHLYIYSGLRADNESRSDFRNNAVIDVYDLPTGSYLSSFYVPHHQKEKLNRLAIVPGYLIGFYDHHVVSYRFGLASD